MSNTTQVKLVLKKDHLPLMEHFNTIQGEGFNTGKAAYFIRLAGCDVGCVWCDVKDSWDANKHPQISIQDMLGFIQNAKANNVVITGGEPLIYDLTGLTTLLRSKGLNTWIETSGAYAISGNWDWICLSPKKFKKPVDSIYQHANELKIVVYHKSDFEWAIEHASKVTQACKLYIQPEWSKRDEMTPAIIEFVKEHPEWTISLQTHKYLNIP
jgi:7-carboxy-7-deazaguanine synthase